MTRVEQWERRSEVPLLLLAAAFLVAYAWPVLDPGWTPTYAPCSLPRRGRCGPRSPSTSARILNRSAAASLAGRVSAYVVGVDALWWAATTVTTVGYGDRYPVTTEGRFIAVALMVVGIAMVGAVTASVAAWMVAQVERNQEAGQQ